MTAPVKIIPFPGVVREPCGEPTVLEFSVRLRTRVEALSAAYAATARLYDQFERFSEVWPDQCARLETALCHLGKALCQMNDLLAHAEAVPRVAIPLRYSLVVALHCTRDQIDKAIEEAHALRSTCRTRPRQASQHRQQMRLWLERAMLVCQGLSDECTALLDRTHFAELALP